MTLKVSSIQKLFLFTAIVLSFTQTLFFAPTVGGVSLMPFRIVIILCLFLTAVDIIMNHGFLDVSRIKVKPYLLFFFLWAIYSVISIIWAFDQEAALRHSSLLIIGIIIVFLFVYYLSELTSLKALYWLLLIIFVALLFIAYWEIITGNHLKMSRYYIGTVPWKTHIPTTIFFNQNDYAAFLALALPLVLVWIRHATGLIGSVLGLCILVTGSIALMVTESRACQVAFAMSFFFWFVFLLKHNRKTIIMSFCIGLFLLYLISLGAFQHTITELSTLSPLTMGNPEEVSLWVRLHLYLNAIYISGLSFPIGVGAGNAEYYMLTHKIYPVATITNVHNWWLEILVNYGVLIFLGYVITYLSILHNLWKIHKRLYNQYEIMICEALLTAWVSFVIASIASSSAVGFAPQWIYLGFILAFINYYAGREESADKIKNDCHFQKA